MPKFVLFAWVKNVNNLRAGGWVSGVLSSPVNKKSVQESTLGNGKLLFTQLSIPSQTTLFSTLKNLFFTLLNISYTHNPQGLLLRPLMRI